MKKLVQNGWIHFVEDEEHLSAFQEYHETDTPWIIQPTWSITGACNAACRHCFITDHQNYRNDLTTDEMLQVIRKLSDASIYQVLLTGGDPLMRKDLPVLLEAMHKSHIKVTVICTNGFLLDDRTLDLLLKYGMRPLIQISFDGLGCHDWMRGVPGAEKMAIAAMERCRKKDIPFSLAMCLHKGNQDSLARTVLFAAEQGACRIDIAPVMPEGDFSTDKGIELLSYDELFQLYMDYLPTLLEEKPDIIVTLKSFLEINASHPEDYKLLASGLSCTNPKEHLVCETLNSKFHISETGRVFPCFLYSSTVPEDGYLKITEHSLAECLNTPAYRSFASITVDDVLKHNAVCAGCEYRYVCGCRCRVLSDGLYGTNEVCCTFYRNGWGEKLKTFMKSMVG